MKSRVLVPAVGALALVLGFAVAQATGVRWLGGIVLIIGGAWCAWRWYRAAGVWRAIASVLAFILAFIVSHPLGTVIGSWPSVILVSLAAALVTLAITAPKAGDRAAH